MVPIASAKHHWISKGAQSAILGTRNQFKILDEKHDLAGKKARQINSAYTWRSLNFTLPAAGGDG
jgi:hypothetical protein